MSRLPAPALLALALLGLGLAAPPAAAQSLGTGALGEPEEKLLVLREVFSYASRPYTPPHVIEPVRRSDTSYASPEGTLTAWVSAASAEDEAWLAETAKASDVDERTAERTRQERAAFDALYRGKRLVLTHRIDLAGVTLIRMRNLDPDTGEAVFTFFYAFERQGKRWMIRDLPTDRVVQEIVENFDPDEPTVVEDEGTVVSTVRPR